MQEKSKNTNKGKIQQNKTPVNSTNKKSNVQAKTNKSTTVKKSSTKTKQVSKNTNLYDLQIKISNYISKTFNKSLLKKVKFYDVCYGAIYVYAAILIFRYIYAIYALQDTAITNNVLLNIILTALPFAVWAFSTITDKYHFYDKKKMRLKFITIIGILTMEQPVLLFGRKVLASKVLEIEVTKNMTADMVVTLARVAMLVPFAIVTIIVGSAIMSFYGKDTIIEAIENFKINGYIDLREKIKNKYDLPIFKDLNTGQDRKILEWDRFVHMFINGQSGTGKTSSTIIPAIAHDLNIKVANMEQRHPLLYKMLKGKKAYIKKPVSGKITEYDIYPRKKEYEEEFNKILKDYPDCGITVMAPNNSMNDTIIDLCKARNIRVNVIDPICDYKNKKNVTKKGINNFYIDETLSEDEINDRIVKQAQDFSEVLVATNESAGTSDQYFRDINTTVSTNVAIICMLDAHIKGKQTDMQEVQNCINDFSRLAPKVADIEEYYDIRVSVGTKKKTQKSGADLDDVEEKENYSGKDGGESNPYFNIIQNVKKELINPQNDKMDDQSRGLRNLINKVMMDKKYANIFTSTPENSVNFDKALRNCEVTIINTAIERGSEQSTMLGLTILLNLSLAIKRRPKDKRPYHFVYVDEASQYMHKVYEDMFALFRQYNAAICIAMQSISQIEKQRSTAYLKNVIMGAGTQIVFGRVSAEEMKTYSELAGTVTEESIQKTESTTSMFENNASQSSSERTTNQKKNRVESSDVRNRGFQEVTVFKIKEGAVEPGFIGKCNFLDKEELKPRKVIFYDFNKLADAKGILTLNAKKMIKETKKVIDKGKQNSTILVKDANKKFVQTQEENVDDLQLTDEEVKQILLRKKEEEIKNQKSQASKEKGLTQAAGQKENSSARPQSTVPSKQAQAENQKEVEEVEEEIHISEEELEEAKQRLTIDNLIQGMFEDNPVQEDFDIEDENDGLGEL